MLRMELETKHVCPESNSRDLRTPEHYNTTHWDFTGDSNHKTNAEMYLVPSLCLRDVPCFAAISHENVGTKKKGHCLAISEHSLTLWAMKNQNTDSYKSPPKHGLAVCILSANNRVCDSVTQQLTRP